MAASITDLIDRVTDSTTGRPVISALAAPGKAIAAPSINLTDVTNWTTATAIHFSIYKTMVVGGVTVKDPTTQTDWKGVLSGSAIGSLTLTGGTDRAYVAGDIVELTPTARFQKDLYELLITLFNQDASLKPGPIQTALGLGAGALNGWNALGFTPNTVTPIGNRMYNLVFNAQDLTSILSEGTRLRSTRTVPAPTQCTLLNGTNQFWNRSATINGMTFTNNFTITGWLKLTALPAVGSLGVIASRYNGTSGWILDVDENGTLTLRGRNAGSGNEKNYNVQKSLPVGEWVHIAISLDMTSAGGSTVTGKCLIDGVDTVCNVNAAGTNPTTLVQAGNLEIGSQNGGTSPFNGEIAQLAIFSAVIAQATLLGYKDQGMSGAETSLVSAYSFSNSSNDLNGTNANNLTANNAVAATTNDSPFGGQSDGSISSTLDYMIVQKAVFATNTTVTVMVAEGCTIPSSGGVTSMVYSGARAPYRFPAGERKWTISAIFGITAKQTSPTINQWYNPNTLKIDLPPGDFDVWYEAQLEVGPPGTLIDIYITLSTANNSETMKDYTFRVINNSSPTLTLATRRRSLTPTSASALTPYYLNIRTANTMNFIDTNGGTSPTTIRARNRYL